MSYQPYQSEPEGNLVPSGVSFFGSTPSDQVHEASTNFRYNSTADILHVGNITIDDDGTIGSVSTPNTLSIGADGTSTFGSGVVIQGDLTVNGTQFISNTETVVVSDNIILLNSGVTGAPSLDAGIEIERGDECNVQILWNEQPGKDYWTFTNGEKIDPAGSCESSNLVYHPFLIQGSGVGLRDGNILDVNLGCGLHLVGDDVTVLRQQFGAITCSNTNGLGVNICADGGLEIDTGVTDGCLKVNAGSGLFLGDDGVTVKLGEALDFDNQGNLKVSFDKEALVTTTQDSDELLVDRGGDLVRITKETFVSDLKKTIETIDASKTSSYDYKDVTLVQTPAATNIVLTLPEAKNSNKGKVFTFKRLDNEADSTVRIQPSGSQRIDDGAFKKLYYRYESINLVSDASNWFII